MEEEIKKVVRQMILDGEITIKVESKDVGGYFTRYESKILLSVKKDDDEYYQSTNQNFNDGVSCEEIVRSI